VLPRGLGPGQVYFRSYNSCLSLGASPPRRRRACVLFGASFRGEHSPTGLPGDTVWLALPPNWVAWAERAFTDGCTQTDRHRHKRETRYTQGKPAVYTHGDVRAQLSREDGASNGTEGPAGNVFQHGACKVGAGVATSTTTATTAAATATAARQRASSPAHHPASSSASQPTPDRDHGQPRLPKGSGATCGGGGRGRAEGGTAVTPAAVPPVAAGSARPARRVMAPDGGRRHPGQCISGPPVSPLTRVLGGGVRTRVAGPVRRGRRPTSDTPALVGLVGGGRHCAAVRPCQRTRVVDTPRWTALRRREAQRRSR